MKRVELIKAIEGFGCVLIRHGARHDWYRYTESIISRQNQEQANAAQYSYY